MVNLILVAHPSRAQWVKQLTDVLRIVHVVTSANNAFEAHQQALLVATQLTGRVVIIEDDAIPVTGFIERAEQWHRRFPDELISFYLGTGRPPQYQASVTRAITDAREDERDWIEFPHLIHAVCYSLPQGAAQRVLDRMPHLPPDFAIGIAHGRRIVYPIESLVEHRDGPSIERHMDGQPRLEKRVARHLAAPLEYEP